MRTYIHMGKPKGFTIIEVTLALGLIAGALLAIFSLIPGGLSAARKSSVQVRSYQMALLLQATIQPMNFDNLSLGNETVDLAQASQFTLYTQSTLDYPEFSRERQAKDDLKIDVSIIPTLNPVTSQVASSQLVLKVSEANSPDVAGVFFLSKAKVTEVL